MEHVSYFPPLYVYLKQNMLISTTKANPSIRLFIPFDFGTGSHCVTLAGVENTQRSACLCAGVKGLYHPAFLLIFLIGKK